MPRSPIFAALVVSSNLAADDTLVAALAEAAPDEAGPIVEALVARRRPAGLFGLVAAYHRLDQAEQRFVVHAIDHLYGTLRDACADDRLQTRLNAIAIVNEAASCRLAYLLHALLRDPSARVREAAALGLRSIADRFLTESSDLARQAQAAQADDERISELQRELALRAEDRRLLTEALAGGVDCFDVHHHPPVLEAAMWFVDDLKDKLWQPLKTPASGLRRAAIEIVRRSASARLVPFAIEAMVYNDFRPHVLHMLTEKAGNEILAELACQSWRIAADPIRRAMAHVRQWPRLAATFGQPGSWTDGCLDRGVRLVRHSSLPGDVKLDLLRVSLSSADSGAQYAAVWALCDINTPAASTILQAIVRQNEGGLARIARRELRRRARGTTGEQAPPNPSVARTTAPGGVAARTPELERLWAVFESLSPAEQAVESAALLAVSHYLDEFVETRLADPDAHSRTKALRILALSGRATDIPETVYALAHDAHPTVRSAALSALGQVRTSASERILRAALNDPDGRVRANAVEAIDRLTPGDQPNLFKKLHDPDNRTRANAAKALLKLGIREAAEVICAMLRDSSPRQRISALWVVERLQLAPLLNRIVELADRDPDMQVRERAQYVLGRIAGPLPLPADAFTPERLPSNAS